MSRRAERVGAVVAAAAGAAVLGSCSTADSRDLRTSGIESTVTVSATDTGIDVTDYLGTGGLSSVRLGPDDHLSASAGGASVVLDEQSGLGTRVYTGHLDVAPDPGVEVVVAPTRGSGDTSAPSSGVSLPPPVELTAPVANSAVRADRDLTFTTGPGDPGAASWRITWDGACVVADPDTGVSLPAGGPVVLPAGSLVHVQGQPRSCPVVFGVTRVVTGTLDPAFKSGGVTAGRTAHLSLRVVVRR